MRRHHPLGWRIGTILIAGLCASFPTPSPAAILHVVIAGDASAPGIGPDMDLSRKAVRDAVIVNTPRPMCDLRLIPPATMGKAAILAAIRSLRVGPDDAVMLYYLGHGAYSPSYGTYTEITRDRDQHLFLSEARAAIAALRPRLGVVVFDCCNGLKPVAGEPTPSLPAIEHPEAISPLFDSLFFGKRGIITITSSAPREYSIVLPTLKSRAGDLPRGALFSQELAHLFLTSGDDRQSWEQLLARTQEEVDFQFKTCCRGGMIPLGDGRVAPQARQTITYRWQ